MTGSPEADGIDPAVYRQTLGRYPTGVTIVTAEGSAAMVIGSFGSVSLEPPLVSFLPAKSSATWPLIEATGHFAVSVLAEDQGEICETVFDRTDDPFVAFDWHPAPSGAPVLAGCLAWVDCRITEVVDAGDHWIVLGAVLALGEEDRTPAGPLVFWNGIYSGLADLS